MNPEQRKPGVAFWSTVVLVAVLAYPVSFGPACWIVSWAGSGSRILATAYRPIIWVWDHGPRSLNDPLHWYTRLGSTGDWWWRGYGDESEWSDTSR
jgi:hypothetical protein